MDTEPESRAQVRLLLCVGALVVLTAVLIALPVAEPSHDPAELDGDPDGAMFDAAGFFTCCVLALTFYALIALFVRPRLRRLPRFLPRSILELTASRVFLPALAAGLLFGTQGAAIKGGFAIVWVIALASIVIPRVRRAGGTALFLGVAVGTGAGIYLLWLYEFANS